MYQEEKWKNLKENSNYFISNYGNFKSTRKPLKININKRGYYYCNVSTKGVVTKVKIHILVAKYFVKNPLNKNTVNHKDGNKLNNYFNNLEWNTLKENIRHGLENGLYGEKRKQSFLLNLKNNKND